MLFRIWFLYLCKLAFLGFVLSGVGFFSAGQWRLASALETAGLAVSIPLCMAGAVFAVVILVKKRLACPICANSGEFVVYGKSPAVECEQCGLVHCKSVLFSFELCTEPLDDGTDDDVE